MNPNSLFTIDEEFIDFQQTPTSSNLWSFDEASVDMASLGSPISLTEANFANVSPNPLSGESQSVWSRDTPVLDRFRIGAPSPSFYAESNWHVPFPSNAQPQPEIPMNIPNQEPDFSFLDYEEIAAELDGILESFNYEENSQRGQNRQDVTTQTEEHMMPSALGCPNIDMRESVCGACHKPFYNIIVEAAAKFIKRTETRDETVRERELRTKSFFCGVETAVQLFSCPPPCRSLYAALVRSCDTRHPHLPELHRLM